MNSDNSIRIHCLTLNCAGKQPSDIGSLLPIFKSEMPPADLYVVALQEIVELTGTNYVFSSEDPINAWRKLLTDTINAVN
jgi:hypothetical protein